MSTDALDGPTPAQVAALAAAGRLAAGPGEMPALLARLVEALAPALPLAGWLLWQEHGGGLAPVGAGGVLADAPTEALTDRAAQVADGGRHRERPTLSAAGRIWAAAWSGPDGAGGPDGCLLAVREPERPFSPHDEAALAALAALMLAVTARAQVEAARRLRAEALAQLEGLGLALDAGLDPRAVAEVVVRAATRLSGAAFSTVLLTDESGLLAEYVTDDPLAASDPMHRLGAHRPQGLTNAVLRGGHPVVIEQAATDPRVSPLVRWRRIGALVGLPLPGAGQPIGLLWLNFAAPRAVPADELADLTEFAARAARAVGSAERRTQASALTERDPLTRLASARSLMARLRQEVTLAQRGGWPLAIVMVDVIGLQAINEAHGLLVSNAVLQAVAGLLVEVCRKGDIVGRSGGDAFTLILPQTEAAGARALAERIIRHGAGLSIATGRRAVGVTLGIAVAGLAEAADAEALASLAAARLASGRGQHSERPR